MEAANVRKDLDFDASDRALVPRKDSRAKSVKLHLNERITYVKLMQHVTRLHPTKLVGGGKDKSERQRFAMWDDLGSLELLTRESNRATNISEMAREIGVGPSLFLMTTKAFSQLFCVLSVLYIPLIVLYWSSHPHAGLAGENFLV